MRTSLTTPSGITIPVVHKNGAYSTTPQHMDTLRAMGMLRPQRVIKNVRSAPSGKSIKMRGSR